MKTLITLIIGISIGYIGSQYHLIKYKKGSLTVNISKTKKMIKTIKK